MAEKDRGFSDLLSTATSLLNKTNPTSKPDSSPNPNPHHDHIPPHGHKPSYGEIYSSAQTVMNAAKAKIHKTDDSTAELDKAKLAGATGTLIGAVSHYVKLDESSYGKYAQKAQDYLHSYEVKHANQSHVSSSSSSSSSSYPASHPNQGPGHGSSYTSAQTHGHEISHGSTYTHQPAYVNQSISAAPSHGHPYLNPPTGYPSYNDNKLATGSVSQDYVQGYPPPGYPRS